MIGIIGAYKEAPEFLANGPFIWLLDQVVKTLEFDPKKATREHLKETTANFKDRIEPDVYLDLVKRQTSSESVGEDRNHYSFNHFVFDGVNNELMKLFLGYRGSIPRS